MGTCLFCHEVTSGEFCSDLCYLDYQAAQAEISEQLENDERCDWHDDVQEYEY